jgi:hypothetical protein
MDPSVQFLLGQDVPPDGATIHSIAPELSESMDDDKIGFTLDVAVRLDQEQADETAHADIVPIVSTTSQELADSA